MDDHAEFVRERQQRIASYGEDASLQRAAEVFAEESIRARYSYNFEWLGLPIIQYPQDVQALQEIIWRTRPDCIIETGVARGGSLVFHASMLELLGGDGIVVGIDIDIRQHNRKRIVEHPLARRIRLIDGSSIEPATVAAVRAIAGQHERIMVCLDSNHTHAHVLKELECHAPLVSPGCYCVVFDTIIELMPRGFFADRPWDRGNNPSTAVEAFLGQLTLRPMQAADGGPLRFEPDAGIDRQLLVSAARGGYLRRCRGDRETPGEERGDS